MAVDTSAASNFNRYNYAANNPYRSTDPDGREAMDWVHGVLTAASFCPSACGSAFSAVDGAVSLAQGNKADAGISFGAAAIGLVSDAGAAKVIAMGAKEVTGTYKVVFKAGEYVGKGPVARMEKSALKVAEKHADEVVSKTHTPASSSREAFKEESRQIDAAGGARSKNPDTKLYNQIDSPGKKMRIQDGEGI